MLTMSQFLNKDDLIAALREENERLRGLVKEAAEYLEEIDFAADTKLYWRMLDELDAAQP